MKQYCSSTSAHYAAFTVCTALCCCAIAIRHSVHICFAQTLCSCNCSKERDSGDQCSFFAWKDVGGEWDQQLIGQQQQLDIFEQLKNVFGHHRFRHGQEEVVRAGMRGRDVFVLIPTVSQNPFVSVQHAFTISVRNVNQFACWHSELSQTVCACVQVLRMH
jgi:hypothetical protein